MLTQCDMTLDFLKLILIIFFNKLKVFKNFCFYFNFYVIALKFLFEFNFDLINFTKNTQKNLYIHI